MYRNKKGGIMKLEQKAKTHLDTHALELAVYLWNNFESTRHVKPVLTYKSELAKKIQNYLDENAKRISENTLLGIIAVQDIFRNATGGRIHMIAGMRGPLVEAFQEQAVQHPIDYEDKHKCLIQAVESTSGVKGPEPGNDHFHPLNCILRGIQPATLFEFIRKEHGFQNELQQVAPSRLFVLKIGGHGYFWDQANAEVVYNLFCLKTDKTAT